ncbi:hypothetical protein C4553_01630 [Candidatus Parcubacteria bacterium]|nr:MAG: hypothetical protein C4553_01630 [Candidatus Parcubacteria bacterium]
MYAVKLEKFEGPLELLLELIEKEKLSITEISLSKVTDQYLGHLNSLTDVHPEMLADFLVIAAQLILIKSKTLLPDFSVNPEEEKSVAELKRRLEELKLIKDSSLTLREILKKKNYMYERNPNKIPTHAAFVMPESLTIENLKENLLKMARLINKPKELKKETMRLIISLEQKIEELKTRFSKVINKSFGELLTKGASKLEIVVTFLALLELTKQKFIKLTQENPFQDIQIRKA